MQSAVVPSAVTAEARRELGSRLVTFAERWFDIPRGSIQDPKRRNGDISKARWALSHVLSQNAGWSEPKIAKLFFCNPSSINTGKRRAQGLLRADVVFFDAVERLQREIAP